MSKNKNKMSKNKDYNTLNKKSADFRVKEVRKEYLNIKSALTLDKYKFFPPRICEIVETLDKFCLYVKGTSGRIFRLYMEIIDKNAELLRLEQEKFLQECKQNNQ